MFSKSGYDRNSDSHGENSAPDLNRTAQREIHIQLYGELYAALCVSQRSHNRKRLAPLKAQRVLGGITLVSMEWSKRMLRKILDLVTNLLHFWGVVFSLSA